MRRPKWTVLAAAVALAAGEFAAAQEGPPPPAPVPVLPVQVTPPAPAVLGAPQPTLLVQPGAPQVPPPPAPPPLFAPAEPGVTGWGPYGPPSGPVGWFVNGEVTFLKPTISGQLTGSFPFNGETLLIAPEKTGLDWTASPMIQLGFRLPDNSGEFSVGYRFVASEGTGSATDDFGTLDLRSRLNLNVIDFDYGSVRYSPAPRYEIKWRIGARMTSIYFDNRASDAGFSEQASSYFLGGGPHASLDVERQFTLLPAFALFGRIDGSVAVGQVCQNYRVGFVDGTGTSMEVLFPQNRTQSVPSLLLQGGLSYSPPGAPFFRLVTGYQFERFWDAGKIGDAQGDVMTNGVFLRGEFNF